MYLTENTIFVFRRLEITSECRCHRNLTEISSYKRVSANWKGNVGTSSIEEIPVSEAHKLWATEVGILFGMDILTVINTFAML